MRRCLLTLAVAAATLTSASPARAKATKGIVTGDPFAAPLDLAGTWQLGLGAIPEAEALGADPSAWRTVAVPGKWEEIPPAERQQHAWYALDVRLPPKAEWPEDRSLSLLLPPFLVAYRVYVGGELVGESGRVDTTHRGPNAHLIWPVPSRLIDDDGRLRIRVRVNAGPHSGTYSASQAEGVAVGPPAAIERRLELTKLRVADLPPIQVEGVTRYVFLGIGFVYLLLFVVDLRRREFGWYALALFSSCASGYLGTLGATGELDPTDPMAFVSAVLLAIVTTASWKVVSLVLDQSGRLVQAAIGLPWLYPMFHGGLALTDTPGTILVARLFNTLFPPILIILGLWMIARGWRARHPDARTFALGFGMTLVLMLISRLLWTAGGQQAFGGPMATIRLVLGVAANVATLGTAGVVLALRYRRAFRAVERAHEASVRFVPEAFLGLLGREDVVSVKRGDASARVMTVLFSDIRGFTKLSEQRSPEDNFGFINRYLERMEPCIVDSGGFINQYYGDGIMALFTSADDALKAARAMQREVEALSDELEREGHARLEVGVGIHSGPLMLGTIGGSKRLDTGVIGDAVNLAARVEGLTKRYGCRVLLSGETEAALEASDDRNLREVDRVRVVGRDDPVRVFQLVDAEDEPTRNAVLASLEDFAKVLADYRSGAFAAATKAAEVMLTKFDDGPTRALLASSQQLEGSASDWDGVTVLESK